MSALNDGETWSFYGRSRELAALAKVFGRPGFFFLRVSRRRRIGKTTVFTCTRDAGRLVRDRPRFDGHVARRLALHPELGGRAIARVAVAPALDPAERAEVRHRGCEPLDLSDLVGPLL